MENKKRKFVVIMGARPNFVKAAPFFKEAKKHPEFEFTIIHTGQHFDQNMSKIFFEEMAIPKPDFNLDIQGKFHTEKIGKMFTALTEILSKGDYEGVIVFGDVNSTLAGAVASMKSGQKLIHIEAGLRSHDRRMPEEINRAIVDHLSESLFTTEPSANENLEREGVPKNKIHYVGNIMINSIEIFRDQFNKSDILKTLNLQSKKYVVATIHRQENTDNPMLFKKILMLLNEVNGDIPVVLPIHPGTKHKIEDLKLGFLLDNLNIVEPLGYFDFMKLMSESQGVITDSGGIQEETTHLGISCATLRDNTERPITLEKGSNKLFSIDDYLENKDVIKHLQRDDFESGHIPLWDDKVAERIFKHL
ncbi:UDP-N-acetylglucosamine 2-epimerase (non-hydrolyzing) [Candidatus Parcubacteria bacterium]|nr:UDP-N-acetylglucosamine 2-epimerase (non-hydrolyzing) [Candidatus Parcubacteria bacterium]MBT7228678.1 UDP-N-acetylglucosamine 2-epimerase (non-hydrolyzing) [Candidatus Parcubacteria bacterium]